ncbi:cysteine desulfurase NifS [Pelomyxa schiedti]|nr:cysteine desulfurase NifS [Pelomyxa schiedti]
MAQSTRKIYLDSASTGCVEQSVVDAMVPYFHDKYYASDGDHQGARTAREEESNCMRDLRSQLNSRDDDRIILTSSGTEACNQVIKSVYFTAQSSCHGRTQIITSLADHPAITRPCRFVQERGIPVCFLPCDLGGYVSVESLKKYISEKTALVSITWASHITGVMNPVEEICRIAHEHGALVHIDAVQCLGKIPFSFVATDADFISLSAHKFHGPKGAGLLVYRNGAYAVPLIHGENQMEGNRGGTVNFPGLIGITEAVRVAVSTQSQVSSKVRTQRDRFEEALMKMARDINVPINIIGRESPRLPHISFVSFENNTQKVLTTLDSNGILVSHFYAPGSLAVQGIRFSLSKHTTDEEIDQTVHTIAQALHP